MNHYIDQSTPPKTSTQRALKRRLSEGASIMIQVFSVRDGATEAFQQPFFSPALGSAKRSFMNACNDPKTEFHQHPDDFCLFHLGEFDEVNGTFNLLDSPKNLGLANTYISIGA